MRNKQGDQGDGDEHRATASRVPHHRRPPAPGPARHAARSGHPRTPGTAPLLGARRPALVGAHDTARSRTAPVGARHTARR
ncbi:hypothetical protein AB4225_33325, partial [Streptomyces sp. 2RAF24]|uniref:hypothetical protein n=1 Tax=Streptomyces sp. 2RAF24 TaxID=3232997 RepID=UPI003F990464